jgi:hypothetical protein
MFTIKLYSGDGFRQIIREAESFTILRSPCGPDDDGSAEITLHQKNQSEDCRFDILPDRPMPQNYSGPPIFQRAIIENSAGKTTEMIFLRPAASLQPKAA